MKKIGMLALSAFIMHQFSFAQISESMVVGVWTPGHGKARVKIEKIGNKYYGKTVWLKEPNDAAGKPKTDIENPEPSLRISRDSDCAYSKTSFMTEMVFLPTVRYMIPKKENLIAVKLPLHQLIPSKCADISAAFDSLDVKIHGPGIPENK